MREKGIKFRLSGQLREMFPEHDVEYRIYNHKEGLLKVKWVDQDGEKQAEYFTPEEVDKRFKQGDWIKEERHG